MKAQILSLKNIYKFLTINDYPVYSEGIIRKDHKRGLTLNQFCYENILVDFKDRKNGKVIWRTEGARNRYISEICNRTGTQSVHKEYAREVLAAAERETVLRQVRQMMSFLSERQYQLESFQRKLLPVIELFEKEDEAFSTDIADYFKKAWKQYTDLQTQGIKTNTFCSAWFLTYLLLFSITASDDNESFIHRIKDESDFDLLSMLKLYADKKQNEIREVQFLTGNNTELSRPSLGIGHFFGRQTELFELFEMLEKGGQYLISGMGGCGKTELMRQFLKICLEEKLVDCIAIVQYEGSLARSLVKAFPDMKGTDLSENYKEALARIHMLTDKKILMIIDNMDGGVDENELAALVKTSATIFITSRYQRVKGFKTYQLKQIEKSAAALIFRDNYGRVLSTEDKSVLQEIIAHEVWCHTLTLRMLARTAESNDWSLMQLKEKLALGSALTGYTESERYENLRQVYAQMYDSAKLVQNEKALLRIFAALPYRNYEVSWSKKYFQLMIHSEQIEDVFEKLWEKGWLEKSDTGYSMHPFISECVLSVSLKEAECEPFFDVIIQAWENYGRMVGAEFVPEIIYENDKLMKLDAELVQSTILISAMLEKISGRLSEEYAKVYLVAITMESIYYGITKTGLTMLQKIKVKTTQLSDITNIGIGVMQSALQIVSKSEELQELHQMFEKAKDDENIPETIKYAFAENLGIRYYHSGGVELAEELNDYVLENCEDSAILIGAYSLKSCLEIQKGDYDAYMHWLQKGIELGRENGYEQGKEMQLLLSNLCDLYMAVRQFDEAEKLLDELEQIVENKSYFLKQHLMQRHGNLAMYRGDEGFGVEELKKSREMAQGLYQDTEQSNYAATVVDLAMALNKAKCFEESANYYKEALDIYMSLEGYEFEKHRILNNMCVMYLDQNLPETALDYLPETYERAKGLGGLAFGETANNYSRAYHILGDREKELEYLKEATPILEQFYGGEHPKVIDAKERLK